MRNGFTLFEALLALTLAALLFGGLALYTGGWVRHWRVLMEESARLEAASTVLDRMADDIEAARPESPGLGNQSTIAFSGGPQSLTFVAPAQGYTPRFGLEKITYRVDGAGAGANLVRLRQDYWPVSANGVEPATDRNDLLRGPITVTFAYSADDGVFRPGWTDRRLLPRMIRVTLSGEAPRPWSLQTTVLVRISMPVTCADEAKFLSCVPGGPPQN
jgi:type II secretory pathway component PulJ